MPVKEFQNRDQWLSGQRFVRMAASIWCPVARIVSRRQESKRQRPRLIERRLRRDIA